jgi:hypothetical protein
LHDQVARFDDGPGGKQVDNAEVAGPHRCRDGERPGGPNLTAKLERLDHLPA